MAKSSKKSAGRTPFPIAGSPDAITTPEAVPSLNAIKTPDEPRQQPPAAPQQAGSEAGLLRDALADLKAFREQFRAVQEELSVLLQGMRSEIASAVADVAKLKDRSEQADSELRIEHESQLKTHAAFREAFAEAFAEVRQLGAEIKELRKRPAETDESAENDEPATIHQHEAAAEPEVKKNRFGVTVAPGVVIADVVLDSPAAIAGLIRGDVIEDADGNPTRNASEFREALQDLSGNKEITLNLRRGGEQQERTIRLDAESGEGSGVHFGVTVASCVFVADVFDDSPASAAGLALGDIIDDAHGSPVQSVDQLLAVIHKQPKGGNVVLVVTRAGTRRELVVHLDRE